MDDACTELDKLVVNCEFENKQYVKLIELEKQHIERYQQEIEFNSKETTRLHTAVAQLEDDIKQCNRQFTLNKANIESLKTTSHVLSEHAAAMAAKLELLQEKRQKQRLDHATQIEHYKDVWDRYRMCYEKCPLAAELKILECEKKELTERVKDNQLEIATVKKQGDQLEERSNISKMSLQQFIVKVAELQVKRIMLGNSLNTLQCQKNSEEKSLMAASLENNTQMLTTMQLEDYEEHMESGDQISSPPAVEVASPMITVFSERDERDDVTLEGMEYGAQDIDSSLPCQDLPAPEWISMFQQKSNQKPPLTQHLETTSPAQYHVKETDMDSESSPEVSTSILESFPEPDEPMASRPEEAVQEAHNGPYVSYTKRNDAEESVNIHLSTSTKSTNLMQGHSYQHSQSSAMTVTATMTSMGNNNSTSTVNVPLSAPAATASGRRFNIPSAPQIRIPTIPSVPQIRIPTLNSRSLLCSAPQNISPSESQNVPGVLVPQYIGQPITRPPSVQHPQVQIPSNSAQAPFMMKTPEIPISPQLAHFTPKVTSPSELTGAVHSQKESTKQIQLSSQTKQIQLSSQEKQLQRPVTPALSVQVPRSPVVTQIPSFQSPMVTQTPRLQSPMVTQTPRLQSPMVTQNQRLQFPMVTQNQRLQSPIVTETPRLQSPMETPRFVVPAVSFGPRPAVSRLQSPRPLTFHVPPRSPKQLMAVSVEDQSPQHITASPELILSSPLQPASQSPITTEDMEECSTYFLPMTKDGSADVTTLSDSPDRSEALSVASTTGTTSPFDIEKHRQRMAELKKSPGQPTFVADRRMFPNESPDHKPVGGAGDHGNMDEGNKSSLTGMDGVMQIGMDGVMQIGMDGVMQMFASGDHGHQSSDEKKDYTPTTPSLFNFSDKETTSEDSPNVDRYLEMFGFGSNDETGIVNGFNLSLDNNYESDVNSTNKSLFNMNFGNEASTEKGSAFNFDFGFGTSTDAVEGNSEPVFKINFGETSPGIGNQKDADPTGNYLAMMFGNEPEGDTSQEPAQEFKINFKLV
ncbi:fibrous sheath CABYR-binding protein-like [Dreissena polymorpha]|uniref:Uncharacterized protein n=1 Tax=Dreissena polymorpha TaxID=45954 RepID=A0A9D4RPW7_DREPO|nr:fibrous sheath CABYR-binding protein-like [Dreissena polymorpha]XP_052267480.1 fibrous sheath CABYR-binding protein-like [Dreissena polymorpha]XP_052267481.1 fibrous sheath CABYR-binding protein-like [Dreissena polymorpha]XP_052267482.1 fibrous sheath CABYR-binding protein-like [Dreissena polymorpha]KAH3874247.1 hypothetical protein DPMN_037489 [Dreissena polymorpha]